MHACPDHEDRRPDVWIWITILALWMSASKWKSTSSGRLQRSSHISVLERNPKSWSNTESCPDVLLKRPDGCKLEQFETSRHRGRSEREVLVIWTDDALNRWESERYDTSSGRLMLWIYGRSEGMTCRSDGWQEIDFLPCKLCKIFWNHFWIAESLLKSIFTNKWFCPTECGQLQTMKLPLWPFWDKNHLTG
jgi:hypothetical protein